MNTQVLVEDVWKSFDRGRIEVLKGVALTVPKGEIVAMCGNSGCGKSTLLNVISGLEEVDRGNVRVSGYDVVRESTRVDLLRHHIGYVFQFHHLMPDLTLAENCMVPVACCSCFRFLSSTICAKRALTVCVWVRKTFNASVAAAETASGIRKIRNNRIRITGSGACARY